MSLTQCRLRNVLRYEPRTGSWVWLKQRGRTRVGDTAGTISRGYRVIRVDGTLYRSNRLAWLYMKGEWPERDIDHEDRNSENDKWSNLRLATTSQNIANCIALRKNNTTGFRGVCLFRNGKFTAAITVENRKLHLGYFPTALEAHEAYEAAAIKHFGGFARPA